MPPWTVKPCVSPGWMHCLSTAMVNHDGIDTTFCGCTSVVLVVPRACPLAAGGAAPPALDTVAGVVDGLADVPASDCAAAAFALGRARSAVLPPPPHPVAMKLTTH